MTKQQELVGGAAIAVGVVIVFFFCGIFLIMAASSNYSWALCGVDYNGKSGGDPFCLTSFEITRNDR